MKKFLEEFKTFALRGNLMDMAVGVVVGGAFTSIANSLVSDIIMPIVSLLTGGIDFTSLCITLGSGDNAAQIAYGNFIQNIVIFLITAFAVFLVVKAINKLRARKKKEEDDAAAAAPATPTQEELLAQILAELKAQNAAKKE